MATGSQSGKVVNHGEDITNFVTVTGLSTLAKNDNSLHLGQIKPAPNPLELRNSLEVHAPGNRRLALAMNGFVAFVFTALIAIGIPRYDEQNRERVHSD